MPRAPKERLFRECRTFNHAWEEYTPRQGEPGYETDGHYDRITVECIRCSSKRLDYINTMGDLERRVYIYADGYPLSKDQRLSRAAYRLLLHGNYPADNRPGT